MSSGHEIPTHAVVRMATQYGQLQEFKPDSDSIKSYLERVSLYFAAKLMMMLMERELPFY